MYFLVAPFNTLHLSIFKSIPQNSTGFPHKSTESALLKRTIVSAVHNTDLNSHFMTEVGLTYFFQTSSPCLMYLSTPQCLRMLRRVRKEKTHALWQLKKTQFEMP